MGEEKNTLECSSCRKRTGLYTCVLCEEALCKPCSETLSDSLFNELEKIPEEQAGGRFCGACFDREMAPRIETYAAVMEEAKQVFIFFKTQRKHIPLIRKSKIKVTVEKCLDRDETILRLAYFAAKDGFNAVIDVEVDCKKIRMEGSSKSALWHGSGFPALVDGAKVDRQDFQESIYR